MEAARALVSGGPSAEDLQAAACWGFEPEDFDRQVPVWPDNWPAVELFDAVSTQWRMGYAGPVGLDYTAVHLAMRYLCVPAADRRARFADLQVMEAAALSEIHKARH